MAVRFARLLTALTLAGSASSALAFFDAQALVGKRWYQLDIDGQSKSSFASQEIDLAAHLDPIPLVPIAFGVSMAMGTPRTEDFGGGVDEASLMQAGLDFQAWIPMVPFITPYARLKYPLYGRLTTKGTVAGVSQEATYDLTGPHLNVGAKWSPLPLIKVLFEVGKGMDQIEATEVKVAGAKQSQKPKGDASSSTVLVGLEIGL